ncbi:cation/H(+) antiporter [Streptacidiphilus sp. 4-A2]|nr:cation/H(+) antiporter [Streptacidiphilus sp. 4-A2]
MASPDALSVQSVVLADIAVVLALCALMVRLGRRLHQPPVVAEIAAGLMLGPSLLGLLPGHLVQHIFPADARPSLSSIAQFGLALFMFMTGWELDPRRLRGSGRALGSIAVLAMAVPFVLGGGTAALLYHSQAPHGVRAEVFVLFMATAFSITAFPVLARIIRDQGLSQTRIGAMAMSCAAICDVAAWCVLVLVTAVAGSGGKLGFLKVLALTVGYTAVMALVVRPLLRRALRNFSGREDRGVLLVLLVTGLLLSAFATAWIGLDSIFGAFAFGLVMPRQYDSPKTAVALQQHIAAPLDKAAGILLPVFFAVTGLSVEVTKLGWSGLGVLLIALATAVVGKLTGTAIPARLNGMSWRDAGLFGTLMNTRGLTELVVLTIGSQLGLIPPNLFTVMVLVALATTAMAGPLLRLLGVTGESVRDEPLPEPGESPPRKREPQDAQPV